MADTQRTVFCPPGKAVAKRHTTRNVVVVHNPLAYDVLPFEVLSHLQAETEFAFQVIVPARFGFTPEHIKEYDIALARSKFPSLQVHTVPLVSSSNRFWRTLYSHRQLSRILRRSAPDIVHVFSELYSPTLTQVIACARKLAVSPRIINYNAENIDWRGLPYRQIAWWNSRRLDCAACLSQEADELVARRFPSLRRKKFVLSVDHTLYTFQESGTAPRAGSRELLYVGTLSERKGVDLLLQALARLPASYQLKIIGQGPQETFLRGLSNELKIESRVTFLGYKHGHAIVDAYRSADMLIVPSRTTTKWKEQFGRVLIEAMSCGTPVIGSKSGAIPEVLADAGALFEEGSPEDLVAQILHVCETPGVAARLGRIGRQRVLENYTHRHMAEDLAEIYRSMIRTEP